MSADVFLEYRCYAYNRSKNPEFKPDLYECLFTFWKDFEKEYQKEKSYWDSLVRKGEGDEG